MTTGFNGMVGSRFLELFPDYTVLNLGKSDGVDITDYEKIINYFEESKAPTVVHMAGKTDVDSCEDDKLFGEGGEAWRVNVEGTRNIVKASQKTGKRLIYISTDFVFNGTKDFYTEEDVPDPVNWYGYTKYEGELSVASSGIGYSILRISYPYRAYYPKKKDFVRRILEKMTNKEKIYALSDHIYTPTFIDDIAQGINLFLEKNIEGTYHLVGRESLSVIEGITTIGGVFGLNPQLVPITREQYFKDRAYRPFKLGLKSDKIRNLDLKMNSFSEGLEKVKKQLSI
ncbi:hypothetical protein A3D77_07045 [Candidatus Gottesmanbacteria bacterium RIFCSPHIGHO2_02_FULL_39_11]|uniref:dTDP-4-dehydrorhamnose reductase n=1 Tax=Candidatus Gottesmanbacteria bacterium RIFCSPHIGHO2_02_FULL_39_11 TaxID=1798382 RepID=A0A1F5ZJV8_9BACT|nr:MAG: hypothetical protein A3D77_07045 [Candidatus Gottesmanbacteria bacterium RIFCSPHIGHO2_02_FULL_39_11]